MLALAVAAFLLVSRIGEVTAAVQATLEWIEHQGLLGMIVFVALYVVLSTVGFPATPLTLGGGAAYGPVLGFAVVSLASTLGATAAFLVARYFARDWMAARIASRPQFKMIDEGVALEGWKLVLFTRLSPVFPFNVQNYAYGLTQISLSHYMLASWIGMMPGTLMAVYLGHSAGSLTEALAREEQKSPSEWVLLGLGVVATMALTIVLTRMATRAMAARTHAATGQSDA